MTEADIILETANQWTGFYMISASVMKGLNGENMVTLTSQSRYMN